MKYLLIFITLVGGGAFAVEREGAHYYDYRPLIQEEIKEHVQKNAQKTSTEILEEFDRTYKRVQHDAILNPTNENIMLERLMAIVAMDLAERYQERAQYVINHVPQLNYSQRHPVNHMAKKQHDARIDAEREQKLSKLAKTHGLFFFYSSNCPHSLAFAPTLKMFANQYGFSILPISLDGTFLNEFPDSVVNHGQAQMLNIQSVPAVFAVKPGDDSKPILLGYGNLSIEELAHNIVEHIELASGKRKYEILR